MKGEFKELYGKEVEIYYNRTIEWQNKAIDIRLEGAELSNGARGILKTDTENFVYLTNAKRISTNPVFDNPDGSRVKRQSVNLCVNKRKILEVMVVE